MSYIDIEDWPDHILDVESRAENLDSEKYRTGHIYAIRS